MKFIVATLVVLTSVQAFAYSTVTLLQDVTVKETEFSERLLGSVTVTKGNKDCDVDLSTYYTGESSVVIPAGTKFQVYENKVIDYCGNDWGRFCSVRLSAINLEVHSELFLRCRQKSFFATKFSKDKINNLAGRVITIE